MSASHSSIQKKNQSSTSSLRKIPPIHLQDPFLERILTEDENYLNVLAVRDELIENALDQCFESYIKMQSVNFIVDCLHQSYRQIFNLIYMHYDSAVIDQQLDIWKPDVQFQPLPCDNYAEFSVPFTSERSKSTDEEAEKLLAIQPSRSKKDNRLDFLGDKELFKTSRNISEFLMETEQTDFSSGTDETPKIFSELSGAVYEDTNITAFETGTIKRTSDQEEMKASIGSSTTELFEEITSEMSFFTGIAEAEQNFLPPIESLRCEHSLVKIAEIPMEKPLKVSVAEKKNISSALPPLRLKAKFKSTDNARSNCKFDRSLGSLDKSLPLSGVLKSTLKQDSSKQEVKTEGDNDEKNYENQEKKPKKVDIVE